MHLQSSQSYYCISLLSPPVAICMQIESAAAEAEAAAEATNNKLLPIRAGPIYISKKRKDTAGLGIEPFKKRVYIF